MNLESVFRKLHDDGNALDKSERVLQSAKSIYSVDHATAKSIERLINVGASYRPMKEY